MSSTLLFIVEDAFQITGRRCVLVPGPSTEPSGSTLRVGDPIRLVKPDDQEIATLVRGVEMINRRSQPKVVTATILLPKEIAKDQVPIGTGVLRVRD